jgi:membrane-associated phospholipid phosphatase
MFLFDGAATINSKRLPQALIDFTDWFTDFGRSGWFLIPTALMLGACVLAGTWSRLSRMQHGVLAAIAVRAEFVFIAVAVPGLVDAVLKRLIGRARPLMIDWHIPHPFSYSPFNNRGAFHSMPSGHATTAVCVAIILGAMWPKARPYLWIYAVAICMSRVILLSHHVSDILIGALIGAFFAILIRDSFAARGLIFYVDKSGQVTPKPGPSWRHIKGLARAFRSP